MEKSDEATADAIRGIDPGSTPRVSDGEADTLPPATGDPYLGDVTPRRAAGLAADPVRIGRFPILQRIGLGGMGVVYAAYDNELDRKVAIKLLRPGGDDASKGERLLREAKALARLSHPSIVQVYEAGTHVDGVYVVMELVQGMTLRAWLEESPRSLHAIVEHYLQAGRGLAAAHAAGIVHRDFKPDNAIVGIDGRVRVLDFGLALATDAIEPTPDRDVAPADLRLTRTGSLLGTPAYMAPEQWNGESSDARTDQFNFAVALFEAVTGARPFTGDNLALLALNTGAGNLVMPPGARMPTRLSRALRRALSPAREHRFADMQELLGELERIVAGRRWRLALLGLAALGLAATAAAVASREAQRERADELATIAAEQSERAGMAEAELSRREHELRIGEIELALEREPTLAAALLADLPDHSPAWVDGQAWMLAQTAEGLAIADQLRWVPEGYDPAQGSEHAIVVLDERHTARKTIWLPAEDRFIPTRLGRWAQVRVTDDGDALVAIEPDGASWRFDVRAGVEQQLAPANTTGRDFTSHGNWIYPRGDTAGELISVDGRVRRPVTDQFHLLASSTDASRMLAGLGPQLVRIDAAGRALLDESSTWHWEHVSADVRWAAMRFPPIVRVYDVEAATSFDVDEALVRARPLVLRFRPNHDQAIVVGSDGRASLLELATRVVTPLATADGQRARWSLDGRRVAIERSNGVDVVEIDSGRTRSIELPRGDRFVSFGPTGDLYVVDTRAWRRYALDDADAVQGHVLGVEVSPTSGVVALRKDGTLLRWHDGREQRLGEHPGARGLALAHRADVVITGAEDGVRRWDLRDGSVTFLSTDPVPYGARITIADDGTYAALYDQAGAITLLGASSPPRRIRENVTRGSWPVRGGAFTGDAKTFWTLEVHSDRVELVAWDVTSGAERGRHATASIAMGPLSSAAGNAVWIGGEALERVIDDGTHIRLVECPDDCPVEEIAPAGGRAAWSDEGEVFVLDLGIGRHARVRRTAKPPAPFGWHVLRPKFAPDGRGLYFLDSLGVIQYTPLRVPSEPDALRAWLRKATDLMLPDAVDWRRLAPGP